MSSFDLLSFSKSSKHFDCFLLLTITFLMLCLRVDWLTLLKDWALEMTAGRPQLGCFWWHLNAKLTCIQMWMATFQDRPDQEHSVMQTYRAIATKSCKFKSMSPLPLSIFVRTGGEGLLGDIFSAVVPQIQVSLIWCCLGSNSSSSPSGSFLLSITVGCNHVHTKSATAITLTVRRNICRVPTIHPPFKSGKWKRDGTENVFAGNNIFKQKMFLGYKQSGGSHTDRPLGSCFWILLIQSSPRQWWSLPIPGWLCWMPGWVVY